LSHTPILFCFGNFGDGVLWTIFPGWAWTSILPITVTQVAKITGVTHQCPAFIF
jgi:hypothetical protein